MKRFLVVFLISLFIFSCSAQAEEMTFTRIKFSEAYDSMQFVNDHGGVIPIYAQGEITERTADQLAAFASQMGAGTIIYFNSLGGSLLGGIRLGERIRKLGFDTAVGLYANGKIIPNAICASACAYAFAGGTGRYYNGGGEKIGVHRFYNVNANLNSDSAQRMSGIIVAYLQDMGVNALAFSESTLAGKDEVIWLSSGHALQLRLSNNGVEQTTAELKQVSGSTYLVLEQDRPSFFSKFLLTCINGSLMFSGGLIEDTPQKAKDLYDWTTNSLLIFDGKEIQAARKDAVKGSVFLNDRAVWVPRMPTRPEVNLFEKSDNIEMMVASDGAMGQAAPIDISSHEIKMKILSFIQNCLKIN